MILLRPSSLALLGLAVPTAYAQQPGSFAVVGSTLVSALMVTRLNWHFCISRV
jgi:hypothetical protein